MGTNVDRWCVEKFWRKFYERSDYANYTINLPNEIDLNTKFKVTCKNNHVFETTPQNFINKNGVCSVCKGSDRWSQDKFYRILHLHPDKAKYTVQFIEELKYDVSKIEVTCENGHIYVTTVKNFFHRNCSQCSRGERWTSERCFKILETLEDKNDFSIKFIENVTKATSKLEITCHQGHTWICEARNYFEFGDRCKKCGESKGERLIRIFLENHQINYHKEKTFSDCKYINRLRFDFYLPTYNLLIEFQGKQHYEPIVIRGKYSFEKAQQQFITIQQRDIIKKQWAIDNNYQFLEIRYDEINKISEILTTFLNI